MEKFSSTADMGATGASDTTGDVRGKGLGDNYNLQEGVYQCELGQLIVEQVSHPRADRYNTKPSAPPVIRSAVAVVDRNHAQLLGMNIKGITKSCGTCDKLLTQTREFQERLRNAESQLVLKSRELEMALTNLAVTRAAQAVSGSNKPDNGKMKSEVGTLKMENAKLEVRCSKLKDEKMLLESMLSQAESDVTKLTTQDKERCELEFKLKEMLTTMVEDNKKLKTNLAALENQMEILRKEKVDMEQDKVRDSKTIALLENNLQCTSSVSLKQQLDLDACKQDLEKVTKKLKHERGKMKDQRPRVKQLEDDINALQKYLGEARGELDVAKQQWLAGESALKEEIDLIKDLNKGLNTEIQELERKVCDEGNKISRLETETKTKLAEIYRSVFRLHSTLENMLKTGRASADPLDWEEISANVNEVEKAYDKIISMLNALNAKDILEEIEKWGEIERGEEELQPTQAEEAGATHTIKSHEDEECKWTATKPPILTKRNRVPAKEKERKKKTKQTVPKQRGATHAKRKKVGKWNGLTMPMSVQNKNLINRPMRRQRKNNNVSGSNIHGSASCSDKSGYRCFCGTKYRGKYNLARHIEERQRGKVFRCIKCNYCFFRYEQLKYHFQERHSSSISEFIVGCKDCMETFATQRELLGHYTNTHFTV